MPRRSDKVYFRSSGKEAAQAETAQERAVEGGEESIALSLSLHLAANYDSQQHTGTL